MNMDDPHYRDCMRDVVAMLEAAMAIQAAGGPYGDGARAGENLVTLLSHADSGDCLKVAVSMLATSWQLLMRIRAAERGTSAEQELAGILAQFRERLI